MDEELHTMKKHLKRCSILVVSECKLIVSFHFFINQLTEILNIDNTQSWKVQICEHSHTLFVGG